MATLEPAPLDTIGHKPILCTRQLALTTPPVRPLPVINGDRSLAHWTVGSEDNGRVRLTYTDCEYNTTTYYSHYNISTRNSNVLSPTHTLYYRDDERTERTMREHTHTLWLTNTRWVVFSSNLSKLLFGTNRDSPSERENSRFDICACVCLLEESDEPKAMCTWKWNAAPTPSPVHWSHTIHHGRIFILQHHLTNGAV